MKDKIFYKIYNIILENLNENEASVVPTNNISGGKIAGTVEAGDSPPVDLRKRKYKRMPFFFKDFYRRKKNV